LQGDYVLETAELMAAADPDVHERTLFILTSLFAMYLRISELVADERSAPVMGDFKKDRDGNWWFHVTGKGNKHRTVTVHWLRHTGISEDVRSRPREHVRDDAGHASMATTDRYIESDQRERHYSGKKKPVKVFE
jgi:site-specific recombinase XerC